MNTSQIIFTIFGSMMFLLSFIVPGLLLINASKSNPNSIIGFRTGRAFLSKETWVFANKEAGNLFVKLGFIYLVVVTALLGVSFLINLKEVIGEIYIIIPVIIPIIFITYIIVKVQRNLKTNFDDNGVAIKSK